ncbi:hypothetical protein ABPG75_013508 [Micractinium tetrahymenae]
MSESLLAAVRHCHTEDPLRSLLAAPHVAAEVNKLGASGVNALGLAVWRNHAGLVEALLEAGADPDVPDTESGWSAMHRALHWGQLRCAAALLRANASLAAPDWRGRTPLDLLSAELKEYLEPGDGDVFSWGNGSNYTLGTGSTDNQEHPARIESLHDQQVVAISTAKFHSVAITLDGRLLSWGWGRGGRLGHPEAHLHSGEGAVISPLAVASLGRRQVAAVAAGKHHTVLCTTAGEVFTCGSNRHGQLGYAVDSQPTPRRVSLLRQRVVAVAAANKHSVAVTAGGDVYTWGCNVLGQLGYGTSDSVSNPAPRLVEAMKGKPVVAAAAAKRHTLVLTASGEVYTWGHRGVSPRRVLLAGARDACALSGAPISFHRGHADVARPLAAAICAGAAHSSALTTSGVVLTWRSADPALQVQEVRGALAGKRVVSIAAGKYRTAAVTDEGDVLMWEGRSDYFPAEGRQPGSGSKKPGSASASRARPIPGRAGGSTRISLGSEVPLPGGSPGSADAPYGGSYGSHSHSRRPGSWIERFAREREAAASVGAPGSYGAAGSGGRAETLGAGGSGSKPSRAGDTFERIRPERVEGLKRAVAVAVGEKHFLAVQRWSAAQLEGMALVPWLQDPQAAGTPAVAAEAAAAEEDAWYQRAADGLMSAASLGSPGEDELGGISAAAGMESPAAGLLSPSRPSPVRPGPRRELTGGPAVGPPSLQRICEEEVARRLVDPRTCLQVLEYADVAGAETLRAYCLSVAVCNLDAVLLEAGGAFEELAPHLLAELERLFKLRLAGAGAGASGGGSSSASASVSRVLDAALQAAEPAQPGYVPEEGGEAASEGGKAAPPARPGSRLQPGRRPTAAAPWLGDEGLELQEGLAPGISLPPELTAEGSSFRDRSEADAEAAAQRLRRMLLKKLQQVEHLAAKAAAGAPLDAQQRCKLEQRPVFVSALAALDGGMAVEDVQSILRAATDGGDGDPELAAAGSCDGSAAPGSASKSGGSAGAGSGASKQSKGKAKRKATSAEEPEAAAPAASASAALPEADEPPSSSLLSSSPPVSSLVPAFGYAGSAAAAAAAAGPSTPSAANEQSSPPAQMRSLVGFAPGAGTSEGMGTAAAAAGQAGEQQPPSLLRSAGSAGRPKSATKRKGGLSMFLRGELEQAAAAAAAAAEASGGGGAAGAPTPAPAWGARSAGPPGAASLRQILDQEAAGSASNAPGSAARTAPGSGVKSRPVLDSPGGSGPVRFSLASFMQSSPMAVQRGQGGRAGEGPAPPPPAWGGAAGSSPPTRSQVSLRAIQQEQEAAQPPPKAYGASPPVVSRLTTGLPPWRPPAHTPPLVGPSLLGTSPSGSASLLGTSPSGRSSFVAAPVPQQSKWYIPDDSRADTRKSLLAIQTEEAAMAELAAQGFDAVRVLPKPDRRAPGLPRPGKAHAGAGSGAGAEQAAAQQGAEAGGAPSPKQQQGQLQQQVQQEGDGTAAAGSSGEAPEEQQKGGKGGSGSKPRPRSGKGGPTQQQNSAGAAPKPRPRSGSSKRSPAPEGEGAQAKQQRQEGAGGGQRKPRQRGSKGAPKEAGEGGQPKPQQQEGEGGQPRPRQQRPQQGEGRRPKPQQRQGGEGAQPNPRPQSGRGGGRGGGPPRQGDEAGRPKPRPQGGRGGGPPRQGLEGAGSQHADQHGRAERPAKQQRQQQPGSSAPPAVPQQGGGSAASSSTQPQHQSHQQLAAAPAAHA